MDFNQGGLDDLLDGQCPWHKDAKHTARGCNSLRMEIVQKKPRFNNDDRRPPRRFPRRDNKNADRRRERVDDDKDKVQDDNFPHPNWEVNFIIGR